MASQPGQRALLATFVPTLTRELAKTDGSVHASVDGSMLSVDISGFTALSERHSAQGRAGAETLSAIISSCFTDLIDTAFALGGDVLKFGGDALLILFRGHDHALRCAGAGAAMQRALGASRVARRAGLTMTAGAGSGPFDVVLAGTRRRELLVFGDAADEVIRLESAAAHGETLVAPAIADRLARTHRLGDHDGGVVVDPALVVDVDPHEPTTAFDGPFEPFVPGPVVEQLDAFAELGGEHRFATVGFLEVRGVGGLLGRDPDEAARRLGDIVDSVASIGDDLGVAPLETDISKDGFKFVLSAGAPLSRGNTNDALLLAALRIVGMDTSFTVKVGAQTGRVFAGFVGHPQRRTYTMMGDCMSTAARMLTVAEDRDVIAVDDVVQGTRRPFSFAALAPFVVKGKSRPITAWRVGRSTGDQAPGEAPSAPLLGRAAEIARAVEALGRPGAGVEVVGEAGSGKTALAEAVLRELDAAPRSKVVRLVAHAGGGAAPYEQIGSAIRQLIGLGSGRDVVGDLEQVARDRIPELIGLLPLVAAVVGAELSPTEQTRALDPRFERDATVAATVALVTACDPGSLGVLLVDDAHWLDESSAAILAGLATTARTGGPRLVVTTRGPGFEAGRATRIEARPLDSDAIRRLVNQRSARALSDAELDAIVSRADGNPLLAAELTHAAATSDVGVLPDSIEQLLAVRIDALVPAARRIVRVAAVAGREFDVHVLAELLGFDIAEVRGVLDDGLDGLVEPVGADRWRFGRPVYRDVAALGLPFRERRRLHAAVGAMLEATGGDDVDALAMELSLHWSGARRHERAWTWSVRAGDRARRQSSLHDAIAAYGRALDAARYSREVSPRERARVAIVLGDVAETAGRYDVARGAYRRAGQALDHGDPERIRLFRRRGVLHEREARYVQAVRWYRRGQAAAATAGDVSEILELDAAVAGIRFRQGRYEASCSAALAVAEHDDAPTALRLRACYVAQIAAQYLGDADRRDHAARLGLELVDRAGDPVLEANLYNNLGIAAYFDGDLERAAHWYDRAFELRKAAGDLIGAVTSVNNLGELRSDQGRYVEAEELFVEARRRASAAGYEMAAYVAECNLGRLATRRGDRDEARRRLVAALDGFERMDAVGFVLETRLRLLQNEPIETLDPAAITRLLDESARLRAGDTIDAPARQLLADVLAARGVDQIDA